MRAAAPSHTLPPGKGMGTPGVPGPVLEGQALPRAGRRETGFPQTSAHGLRPPTLSRGRGYGGTWFPHGHVRQSCAWRTTPAATGPRARAGRPRRGSAGTVPAPSPALPRWGRESGSSPQRGEAGRGAERGERWSPQPSMRLAPHPDGMNILPGRAAPAHTLPPGGGMGKPGFPIPLRAGAWGNPVSPHPSPRGYVHVRPTMASIRQHLPRIEQPPRVEPGLDLALGGQ